MNNILKTLSVAILLLGYSSDINAQSPKGYTVNGWELSNIPAQFLKVSRGKVYYGTNLDKRSSQVKAGNVVIENNSILVVNLLMSAGWELFDIQQYNSGGTKGKLSDIEFENNHIITFYYMTKIKTESE